MRSHFKSSEGPLPYDIHVAALDLWLWLVTELKIEGYLAPWRNGARLNERGYPNFKAGEVLSATEYLDKQWSQCPVARRARDLRIVVRNR